MRSVPSGRQQALTSEVPLTPEVVMRRVRGSDSIADRAWPPAFFRSWTNPDAPWMHVAGDLNLATAPQLVRTLHEPRFQALVVLDLRDLVQIDSFGVRGS